MHIKPVMHLKQKIFMAGYQSTALHGAKKELLFSHSVVSDSLQPHGRQHARLLGPSPCHRVCLNLSIASVMPSSHLSFPSPPAFSLSQHQGLLQWDSSSQQVAKVLACNDHCILWNSPGQNTGVGSFSILQGSLQPRNRTQVSHVAGGFSTNWATRKAQ